MKCPVCKGVMKEIRDEIMQDGVSFDAFKCTSCGEELLNMKQLKQISDKYRKLRKSKEAVFARWGNSLAIRIPRELIRDLKINAGKKALIREERGTIKIIPN